MTHVLDRSSPNRSRETAVAAAGVMMIGVAYGFARYGYGLFEPAIRDEFHLSVSASGAVSSAGYVGYVVGLLATGFLIDRVGPRAMIIAAGAAAVLGLGVMATAGALGQLLAGVIVAGASSGLGWAPYSDVVDRSVPAGRRTGVLAAVASGTAFGIAVAGGLALVNGLATWRPVWWVFCAIGAVVVLVNLVCIPGVAGAAAAAAPADRPASPVRVVASAMTSSPVRCLFLAAFSYGVVGSVYWTFSVSAISGPSASALTGPVFWTAVGVSGTVAIVAGRLFERIGLSRAHELMFASLGVAAIVIALASSSWWAISISAAVYGFAFMATSGLLAVWSYRLFPEHPSIGFTATVLMLGLGSIVGPVVLGVVADAAGFAVALHVIGVVALVTLTVRPAPEARTPTAVATSPSPEDT